MSNRPTLAFATMCKNEEHIIGTVLDAVAPYIDYLVVADNGSTDRTLEIVQEFMDRTGIPGEIHNDEWFGFDKNKNMIESWAVVNNDAVAKEAHFDPVIPNQNVLRDRAGLHNNGPSRDDYQTYGWLFGGLMK